MTDRYAIELELASVKRQIAGLINEQTDLAEALMKASQKKLADNSAELATHIDRLTDRMNYVRARIRDLSAQRENLTEALDKLNDELVMITPADDAPFKQLQEATMPFLRGSTIDSEGEVHMARELDASPSPEPTAPSHDDETLKKQLRQDVFDAAQTAAGHYDPDAKVIVIMSVGGEGYVLAEDANGEARAMISGAFSKVYNQTLMGLLDDFAVHGKVELRLLDL